MISLFWTYGDDETPVSSISKHYSDLNLHAETKNYRAGEMVDIEIDMGNGIKRNYTAKVGVDNVAVARDILNNDPIILDDED